VIHAGIPRDPDRLLPGLPERKQPGKTPELLSANSLPVTITVRIQGTRRESGTETSREFRREFREFRDSRIPSRRARERDLPEPASRGGRILRLCTKMN
jgi:hypothetical protein